MSNLFVWKEQLQRFYSKNSRYIDKVLQFILGIVTFAFISSNVGFMKAAAQPLVTVALGIISAFIPLTLLVVIAAVLILLHMYSLSVGVLIVVAAIFLIMFIFYFRFTPKSALIFLLTPLAFMLKIPYVIPIVFGLIGTPIYVVPIMCGTIVYFLLEFTKSNVTTITSTKGLLDQITVFAQQALKNKNMWVTVAAFIICLLIVFTIRKLSVNNAWIAAIVTGAVVNAVVMVVGDVVLNIHVAYGALIVGSIISVLIAFILQFFVFAVDYSRTEHLQYEDDEYYYYVKAVPKITVAAPEKTVKRINERQETGELEMPEHRQQEKQAKVDSEPARQMPPQTVAIDQEEVKRRLNRQAEFIAMAEGGRAPMNAPENIKPAAERKHTDLSETDEMLLAKSLKEELDIQKIIEKELEK